MSLRQQLRQRRRNLAPQYRNMATEEIVRRVSSIPEFSQKQHIAGYAAFDGEVDPFALLTLALEDGKRVFLPRIHQDKTQNIMHFFEMHNLTELSSNHYGILEPIDIQQPIAPQELELVLTPLVGFDDQAHRIGMGTGYYDNYFSFLLTAPKNQPKPILIGLAFDCQFVDELPLHAKDIPLDAIVTESRIILRNE